MKHISRCCRAETFEERGGRICQKCRLLCRTDAKEEPKPPEPTAYDPCNPYGCAVAHNTFQLYGDWIVWENERGVCMPVIYAAERYPNFEPLFEYLAKFGARGGQELSEVCRRYAQTVDTPAEALTLNRLCYLLDQGNQLWGLR